MNKIYNVVEMLNDNIFTLLNYIFKKVRCFTNWIVNVFHLLALHDSNLMRSLQLATRKRSQVIVFEDFIHILDHSHPFSNRFPSERESNVNTTWAVSTYYVDSINMSKCMIRDIGLNRWFIIILVLLACQAWWRIKNTYYGVRY